MKKQIKRILSIILCLAMLFSPLPSLSMTVTAASAAGTEAFVTTDVEFHDGIDYKVVRTTRYIGNRTYSVQLDISANISTFEHARIRTSARNGYVTIQETGYYLLELWGGDGGDGQSGLTTVLIPSPGGEGAHGGYVYGKVFLKAGQTLVYNIGTNGDQSTVHDDNGGGVNGDGGTHGDQGSYTVGGGGGYTAIYLFDTGEFDESFVTETNISIPESARLSRYLMIAGGGGGGGAGLTNLLANGTASAPNGGMGGNINNGVSMTISGSNYAVPGYIFSGRNGQSSGTSTEYIGRGGSNVPGRVPETLMGYFTATQLPNDWTGTHNPAAKPGAGGSGNFRGGGGGSGYAGGSGGLMTAQLVAANVGGGGGGSSFVAASVNDTPIVFQDLTETERAYLSGASAQPIGATTGGAVQITYLSGAEDEFYQEALDNITVNATTTRYFDVLSSSKTTGTNNITTTVNGDSSTYVTAKGLAVTPSSPAHSGQAATVTLFIRAKDGFLGGNSVPMISGVSVGFKSPNDNVTSILITPDNSVSHEYVNVPLNATMHTNSYTSSQKGKSYAVTLLYQDEYAGVRDTLTSYWEYDCISAISTYRVYENGTQKTGSVAPSTTTTYDIKYDVTPSTTPDPEVVVGPAVESPTTITGKAVISIVEQGTAHLNGLIVTGSKSLNFSNGSYVFSTDIDQKSANLPIKGNTDIIGVNDSPEWTAPADGWYYVEAWGGNGGSGGNARLSWNYTSWGTNRTGSLTAYGGSGGSGGYISTYVYLNKGDVISYTLGSAGSSGSTGTDHATSSGEWISTSGTGGSGGKATTVNFNGQTILIAGGGGGGGGAGFVGKTMGLQSNLENTINKTGNSGKKPSTTTTTISGTYDGSSGGSGSASGTNIWNSKASAGSAGAAGKNYTNTAFGITQNGATLSAAAQKYAKENINTTKSASSGQVAITLIENPDMLATMETVKGISTKVAFSPYFDIGTINLSTGTSYNTRNIVTNDDGSKTVTYTHSTYGQIAKFTYDTEYTKNGTIVTIYDCDYILGSENITDSDGNWICYTANLTVSYTLTPKDGFLGGNDVPVLAYGQTGGVVDNDAIEDYGVRVTQGSDFMNLPAAGPTDFANVENTVDMSQYLTVQDKTIHLGDSVQKIQLYTYTPPTYSSSAWEDDYATFIYPTNETYTPTQTTDYAITVGFVPRIATAEKATIVESLLSQEYSLTSTVYVEVPVSTSLTNLTCDNVNWTLWGEAFGCTITPKAGYILPEEITVTIGGVETNNYTYNSSVGTVSIEGQYVTGPITISAKAAIRTYDIHILYTNYNDELMLDVQQPEVVIPGIQADEVIDWSTLGSIKATINTKPGYNYQWVFETASGEQPETMPAHNLWVYGSYEKASYLLTINYVYENGNPIEGISSYNGAVVYGEEYAVVSPSVKGYLPDLTVVSGTMGVNAITIDVTYRPSKNKLIVLYQKESDGTLLDRYEQETTTGETYTIDSPEIEGYETNTPSVTVTMDGDDTQTVIVKYTPKKYTVTFDSVYTDATLDGSSIKVVEYDNIYAYNAAEKIFDGLPTAQIAGYTFVGWYADESYTTPVKESDLVKITENTTFYAKWEKTRFKLTVRYEFLYENGDYVPEGYTDAEDVRSYLVDEIVEIPYGDMYDISLPNLVGYSAYENFGLNDQEKLEILSGTMPGQNMLVVISYEINTYEIKFMDLPGAHVTYSDAETSTEAVDTFNTVWKTVYVKHNVVPVYEESDVTPNHATREAYTYEFTSWYGSNDGVVYSEKASTFPAATSERNYYAMYDATENVVAVNYGSLVEYFTNVQPALAFAEDKVASNVTINFRRNAGNERKMNLNDDTLVFGKTYNSTTSYTINVNLNGLRLENTIGQPIVENTTSPLNINVVDSGAGGRLRVVSDNDVVAIKNSTGNLTIADPIVVEAISNSGDACGVAISGTSTLKPANITVSGKNAVGVFITDVAEDEIATVAEGDEIDTPEEIILTLSSENMAMTVSGIETAIGIHITEGTNLINATSGTKPQTITSQGDAYGVLNEGTVSSLNVKATVNAANKAYGIYNNAGTVTVTGIDKETDLRATGAEGYGLYNVAEGTVIGSEEGDKLNAGAFAGSSYGIYSADDSIYAVGNKYLYFKGENEEKALSGVVHKYDDESYEKTNAEEGYVNGDDYFRLAAEYTIKFVTNGGTVIEEVTKFYKQPLDPVETKKSGYTFNSWHLTELLDSEYTYPETMPEEDITLYAKWDLNQYTYSLDKEFKELTVNFYKNTSSSDNTIVSTVKLTEENPYLTIPADQTYISNYYVYVQSGWYTGRTPSNTETNNNLVIFDGDISIYDTDNDGIINFYAGWERSSDQMYSTSSYKKLGTDSSTPASAYITGSYDSSGDSYYMYYQVLVDGDYTFNFTNSSSSTSSYARKYGYIYKHVPNSSTSASTSTLITIPTNSSYAKTMSALVAGDVILIKLYRGYDSTSSTYNSTVTCYVSTTADLSEVDNRKASAEEPIEYNVEMGTVTLPVADNTGHENEKFAGWAENATSTRYVKITPDMVDTVEAWKNGEQWRLYSQWTERTWNAYQSGERDFDSIESTAQVTIRNNDTVSIRFESQQLPGKPIEFKFNSGLPAGAILTLIDNSGADPVYYTYTTRSYTTELASTEFVKMGVATESFDGYATDVVLQICYQNTSLASTSETVGLYAGDIVSEVDAKFSITPGQSISLSNGFHDFAYDVYHSFNVTINPSSIPELNLPESHKVFLRVRWDDINLAPGSMVLLGNVEAPIYNGEYAMIDTGMTVGDMMSTTVNATIYIYLPTMVQNEFSDKTFYYELCVAPNATSAFGTHVETALTITESLTLTETPSLSVDEVEKTVNVGDSFSIKVNNADAEFYLYQQNSDGTFTYTENCATVFETLTVDQNGKISAVIDDDTFTATVSETATRGKYYIVVELGDKYERILLKLTQNIQA